EHNLPHEDLDARELSRRFPMFRLPADFVGFLERDAGYIRCEDAVLAMLEAAKALGAELRANEPVTGWEAAPGRVRVDAGTPATAQRLVITAGPWSAEFLKHLGIDLTVTRQVQGWLTPPDPGAYLPSRFPCWGIDIGEGNLFYGFPALPNHRGVHEVK